MNGTQVTPGGGGARADYSDRATAAIRPVNPAEQAALSDFFAALSVESRYRRFFAPVRPSHRLLDLLSGSPANVDAIIAVADGVIVGHAMAADLPERICPDASRITDVARPESVLASKAVRDAVGENGYRWSHAGARHLKGIEGQVRLFRCRRAKAPLSNV